MAKYKTIRLDRSDQVLTITLNRPEALNALNIELIAELRSALAAAAEDKEIAGVIITGSGDKSFAAGADITEIAHLDTRSAKRFVKNGQDAFAEIENFTKPVIAAVNGYALGGGCELAMACHFRVASKTAVFGQPEVNLGLIPGYGGTQRLPKLIGKGRAMEYILTGDMIDAAKAHEIGLVNHVVENKDEMLALASKIMIKILKKAPIAINQSIASINASYRADTDGFLVEANAFASCCGSDDFKEGTSAFLEKRKPLFTGK